MDFSVFSMHSSKPWILLPLSQMNTFGKELHAVWAETPWASEMWWWYGKLGTSFPRWSLKPFAIRHDFHKLPLWSHTKFQNYACWQEAMPHLQHTQPKLPEAQEAELPSRMGCGNNSSLKAFLNIGGPGTDESHLLHGSTRDVLQSQFISCFLWGDNWSRAEIFQRIWNWVL